MDNIPPLPPIEGELMLEVFTHESLNSRPDALTSDEHGGNVRLATLGEKLLEAAVMTNLFRRRPMYGSKQLKEILDDLVSPHNVDRWTTAYNLKSKLRCAPGLVGKIRSADEGRKLFWAYIGALSIQSEYSVVQDWINQLLEPSEKRVKNEPPPVSIPSPLPQQIGAPPNIAESSRHRLFGQFGNTPTFSQPSPRPVQPPPYIPGNVGSPNVGMSPFMRPGTSQPPPPATKPPPLPPTPGGQQISYLPLFNQTASQRRVAVEYTAQFFGPPHAGKWHVKCMVNNIEKGEGAGPSKQLAKEEAAKQAFYAMGWSN
ncbi:hypothetical protein BJ322DRAFT_1108950 [Thelephora terrestris]|uniref:DRBM domain-containing protein n=1 Tax=Thelephora terrestris TaxID=56493 RepID=A0A9P6L7F0_9AGAM|nr:hypothetical protein BJ322DRAFT_1108950 [Thelephora terrestris]